MNQLGQHFLQDEEILAKEVELLEIKKTDKLVEVGAGKGNLTKYLTGTNAIIIELDTKFEKELNKIKNVKLIIGNAIQELKKIDFNKIISNLPYHISEPLFHTIIRKEPELCVFISGTKFYKLLLEKTKIGTGIRAIYDIQKIMDIPPFKFQPEPSTQSVLFVLKKKKQTQKEEIIKEILQQEDKTVKNAFIFALKRVRKITNKEAKEEIEKIPSILLNKRVLHLSNIQFNSIIEKI